jgi:hypothetical protein
LVSFLRSLGAEVIGGSDGSWQQEGMHFRQQFAKGKPKVRRGIVDTTPDGFSSPDRGRGSTTGKGCPMPTKLAISVNDALRLVDMIQKQVQQAESEQLKKILLQAGVKIADLAIAAESSSKRLKAAA